MLAKKVKKRISFFFIFFNNFNYYSFSCLKSLTDNILYFKSPTEIKFSDEINFKKK